MPTVLIVIGIEVEMKGFEREFDRERWFRNQNDCQNDKMNDEAHERNACSSVWAKGITPKESHDNGDKIERSKTSQ